MEYEIHKFGNDEEYLDRENSANYLGVSKFTLNSWASNKKYNLPYLKLGKKTFYKIEDLNAFIEKRIKK